MKPGSLLAVGLPHSQATILPENEARICGASFELPVYTLRVCGIAGLYYSGKFSPRVYPRGMDRWEGSWELHVHVRMEHLTFMYMCALTHTAENRFGMIFFCIYSLTLTCDFLIQWLTKLPH